MATGTLTGQTIANTYKSLLKITGTTAGGETLHASTTKVIEDGDGNASLLQLSQSVVEVVGADNAVFNITSTAANRNGVLGFNNSADSKNFEIKHNSFDPGAGTNQLEINSTDTADIMVFNLDGKIGIKTTSPADDMDIADSNDYVQLNLDCFSTTNTHHGTLVFKKSSNATIGTRASTDDGEALGFIGFNGTNTSSASARGAYIYVTQNGSAGSSNVPAKMAFSTSSNSAAVVNMILDENSRISLSNNDGDANNTTIFGYLAGNSQTSGSDQNCYFGHESGKANVYGDDNVCIGFQSGLALGASSGSVQNSLVGSLSGTAITDGDYNTFLGYRTGSTGTNDITTGTFNTFIGKGVAGSSASATNQTAIGADVTAQGDNTVTLGNADVTDVYMSQDSQAYVHSQNVVNHTANTMSSPYYRFDGVDDYIASTETFQTTFRNSFSISALVRFEDGNPAEKQTIFGVYDTTSGTEWVQVALLTNGTLRFLFHIDSSIATFTSDVVFAEGDTGWNHIVAVANESSDTIGIYLNGNSLGTTSTSSHVWTDYTSSRPPYIGARNTNGSLSEEFQGSIQNLKVWNKYLTASEIKDDYSGASVPFKYKGASQNNLITGWTNSGSYGFANFGSSGADLTQFDGDGTLAYAYTNTIPFVVGVKYRLIVVLDNTSGSLPNLMIAEENGANSISGTDGSFNFAGTELADGTNTFEFTATSAFTTSKRVVLQENAASVNNSATFQLIRIGAVAEYDGSGAGEKVWGDKSGNSLDGTVSGATLENTPYDGGTEYEEGTWTPVLKSGSNTISFSDSETANYIRIGNKVTCNWSFSAVTTSGTLASGTTIEGLPYTAKKAEYAVGSVFHSFVLHFDATPNVTRVSGDSSIVYLIHQPDSANYFTATIDAVGSGSYGGFSITYFTD